mgnify:FL=1
MTDEYLERLRARLVGACDLCAGRGYRISLKTGDVLACSCLLEFRTLLRLHTGGVPRAYHSATIPNYRYRKQNHDSTRIVAEYIDSFSDRLVTGGGLYFTGPHGVGKSYLMCSVLRAAAESGRTVHYRHLSQLLSELADSEFSGESTRSVFDVDLLALDEIDRVYKTKSDVGATLFDRLIRHRCGSFRPVLVASNKSRDQLEGTHSPAIISLFAAAMSDVNLVGKDFRRRRV